MEPIDGEEQDDIDIEESAPMNLDDIADLGLGTSDDEETHAAAETPPPTVFSSLLPFFACPSHTRLTLGSHPCEIGCDYPSVISVLTSMSPSDTITVPDL